MNVELVPNRSADVWISPLRETWDPAVRDGSFEESMWRLLYAFSWRGASQ